MKIKLPEISELTDQQNEILNETGSVAVYGGAGTGKTILSVWKHILNWKERDIQSFLITYTHSLTKYFELSIKNKSLKASQHIENKDRFQNNSNIDMLIIDEAQDISKEQHLQFQHLYKTISYGADDKQILYPDTQTQQKELNDIYQTKEFTLSQNFRNSFEILSFVKSFFPNSNIPKEMIAHSKEHFYTGEKPVIIYSEIQAKLDKYLIKTLNKFKKLNKKIAILVPIVNQNAYFPNNSSINRYKKILRDSNIEFSSYNNEEKGSIRYEEVKNIHLTPFKSSKGLEFDIVIIPNINEINYWATQNRFPIGENDYYVGMTRARELLILLSNNLNIVKEVDSNLYKVGAL